MVGLQRHSLVILCAAALLVALASPLAGAAMFGCEIVAGSCLSNQTLLVRLNSSEAGEAPNNSHAQLANFSGAAYPYSVCCWSDAFRSMGNACTGGYARVLGLADESDSHVQAGSQAGYVWPACLNVSVGAITCEYPDDACSPGYEPVASIASSEAGDVNLTNAHVAAPGHYARQVCCGIGALTPPTVAAAIISPVNATRRDDLLCGNGTVFDADGDAVTLHYNWHVNGTSIARLNLPMDYDSSASQTHDISGNAGHADVSGATFLPVGGRVGGAFSFDGIDDAIATAETSDFGGKNLTVAAWIKVESTGSQQCIVCRQKASGTKNFETAVQANGTLGFWIHSTCGDSGSPFYSPAPLSTGQWHFVAFRLHHGANASIFVDGATVATSTAATSIAGGCAAMRTQVGSWQRNTQWTFNGTIDEAMVFQRPLSDGELLALYETGGRQLNRSGLRKTEAWNCSITPIDSTGLNGTAARSDQTFIEGSLPLAPTLLYPADGNASVFERTVAFDWADADEPDGDALNYTFNLSVAPGACGVQKEQTGIAQSNYTFGELCVDQLYRWNVTACDIDGCSPASATSNFTIGSVLSIVLRNASVDLGSLTVGQSASTDGGAAQPFLLENDGNVLANVTLAGNASPFSTAGLDSTAFQFRVAQNETGSLNETGSQASYVPVPSAFANAIKQLNHSDASDLAAIHVNVTVPLAEPPGAKSANMTLQAVVSG